MKNNSIGLVKSLCISLAVAALLVGAGYFVMTGEGELLLAGSLVEASDSGQEISAIKVEHKSSDVEKVLAGHIQADEEKKNSDLDDVDSEDMVEPKPIEEEASDSAVKQSAANAPVDHKAEQNNAEQKPVAQEAEKTPVEVKKEEPLIAKKTEPVETKSEEPAAAPEPAVVTQSVEVQIEEAKPVSVPPVTYSWGGTSNYTFRIEVRVTNNGGDTSHNVTVAVPMLENNSPYQTTSLKSVNYDVVSSSGRLSTFNLGDIAPGETKSVIADFSVGLRAVSINSTNDTVEKARIAYEQYRGSGNCRTLAQGFISKSRELGVTAREVVGFARPQRGAMTSGSLQGSRHSWAEFYVDGLGWVPVDLTFQYFGEFPHASHVIEGYGDQQININYSGGSLGASWSNSIL